MEIVLRFNTFEEYDAWIERESAKRCKCKEKPEPVPVPVLELVERLPEEEAAPEPETEPEAVSEEDGVDVKALKVELRAMLAKVNKQTGKNIASGWIKELGYKKLTEIEGADELLAIKEKAEEVLNG